MSAREERFSALLVQIGLGYSDHTDGFGYVLDEEGERLCRLSPQMRELFDRLDDKDFITVAAQINNVHLNSGDRAFKAGIRCGEQNIVNVAHRLLGIERIVDAIERASEASS